VPIHKTRVTIRRAIFWGVFVASTPTIAYLSFDLIHLQEEFERYDAGVVPSSWWREPQPIDELDWRFKQSAAWKTLRPQIGASDQVIAFRSPQRPWGSYPYSEGLLLLHNGRVAAQVSLIKDGKSIAKVSYSPVASIK
jgi:hypothetical protein